MSRHIRMDLFAPDGLPHNDSTCFLRRTHKEKERIHSWDQQQWETLFLYTDAIVRGVHTQGQIAFHWHNHSRTFGIWNEVFIFMVSFDYMPFLPFWSFENVWNEVPPCNATDTVCCVFQRQRQTVWSPELIALQKYLILQTWLRKELWEKE